MAKRRAVNVGIIGLGRAGWGMHVQELRTLAKFKIVAGCDVIPDRPRRLAEEFGATPYTDYRGLIKDPAVELVVVATRSDTHARIASAALRAGKDVLMEKPIARNLAQADRLLEAARRLRRRLLVHQSRRYDPDFVFVRDVIASGVLGRVFYVRLCRHGFDRRRDWQTLTKFGGGLLNNWGPHIVDHALQLLGGRPAAIWSDMQHVVAAGDAEDHVKIVMRGKAGLVVDMEISGGVALGEPLYRVMGTLGTLVCDGMNATMKYLDPRGLKRIRADTGTPAMDGGFGSDEELKWKEETRPARPKKKVPQFYDLVYGTMRKGRPFPITLRQARDVMWVIDKARKGHRT